MKANDDCVVRYYPDDDDESFIRLGDYRQLPREERRKIIVRCDGESWAALKMIDGAWLDRVPPSIRYPLMGAHVFFEDEAHAVAIGQRVVANIGKLRRAWLRAHFKIDEPQRACPTCPMCGKEW